MLLTFTVIQTVATVSLVAHHVLSNKKTKFRCYDNNGFKHYKFY